MQQLWRTIRGEGDPGRSGPWPRPTKSGWAFLIGFLLVAGFIIGGFILAIWKF